MSFLTTKNVFFFVPNIIGKQVKQNMKLSFYVKWINFIVVVFDLVNFFSVSKRQKYSTRMQKETIFDKFLNFRVHEDHPDYFCILFYANELHCLWDKLHSKCDIRRI